MKVMLQPKLVEIKAISDYKLLLFYETNESKLFDVKPYISGSWYNELLSQEYFNTVHIINNGNGIEWANGQDIAPHELYEHSTPTSLKYDDINN